MTDYTDMTKEELGNLVQTEKHDPVKHKWICAVCFKNHLFTVNVGLPEKKKCDHCGSKTTCYEVLR